MNTRKDTLRPFHLAFPVQNIQEAKEWYTKILGCKVGRHSESWIDFNFFGHQIVAHLDSTIKQTFAYNNVDGHEIPVQHFGIILNMKNWKLLVNQLKKLNVDFTVKPYMRFKTKKGEQATLFIKDPSGNHIEIKAFANDEMIFDH